MTCRNQMAAMQRRRLSSVGPIRRALILAPMSLERRAVVKESGARRSSQDGRSVYTATLGPTEVVIAQLGVGPAVARQTTEWALARFAPDHVVVTGIAGGLHPDLVVGAVVVPESILDVADGRLYRSSPVGGLASRGLVATTEHLVVDEGDLDRLRADGVLALEMESSGVAEACEPVGVPWTTIRVIGDRPDQHLTDDSLLTLLRPDGTTRLAASILLTATNPRRVGAVMRLARDSSMAASAAARLAVEVLRQ
jgi:adenosylhomocysteine nucleosidase